MEGASGNPEKDRDGAVELGSEDTGEEQSSSPMDNFSRIPGDSITNPQYDNNTEMDAAESMEEPDTRTDSEEHPTREKRRESRSSTRSYEQSQEEMSEQTREPGSDPTSSAELTIVSSFQTTEASSLNAGAKGFPKILGAVRRESSSAIYELSREALDTVAEMAQQPVERSVSVQTDHSWLSDHVFKKRKRPPRAKQKASSDNDIYAVVSDDLSCLEILYHTEFKEDFLRLFQESLRTLSSVGPPTIIAYRPESSRGDVNIELEKPFSETCEFCGSPLRQYPSFNSLEQVAKYGYLFCCQQCRELHEFFVNEKNRYAKDGIPLIDISTKARGREAERQLARERARQRLRERQMAKKLSRILPGQEKEFVSAHGAEHNKQLKTISYSLAQERPSLTGWTKVPLQLMGKAIEESQGMTYNISCCDFTIAGGKLLKKQFLQQYYKNGVKFLTVFPDGTGQIFYPSGNLAIIVVQKNTDAGYICIVHEDKSENAEIQAIFESCGNGTCYHPNGNVWINVTIRGGHYSDPAGNKVKAWTWPNHLQKRNPSVLFKPVFLSLNQNVGVRILGQDKVAISFLAMGKQAKINVGTKVELLADHHPWPKYVSEEDFLLFAGRIKILRIFAKLHGYLDFPNNDWWTKLQLPSYLLKRALKLIHLCKECEARSEPTKMKAPFGEFILQFLSPDTV